jgi:hypothetical protein
MCLNVVGLTLGLIGAIALTASTWCFSPVQVIKGELSGTSELDSSYKVSSIFSTALIAVGFLLQIISAL